HLHAVPSLQALPRAEQPIVARALSKNPETRFPNCRAFIDQLLKVQSSPDHSLGATIAAAESIPTPPMPFQRSPGGDFDEVVADTPDIGVTQRIVPSTYVSRPDHTQPFTTSDAVPLPPLHIEEEQVTYHPTVFLGVGGLATRVLQKLRR